MWPTADRVTSIASVPLTASTVAVRVAVPADSAVTTPVEETAATVGADEEYEAIRPVSWALWLS